MIRVAHVIARFVGAHKRGEEALADAVAINIATRVAAVVLTAGVASAAIATVATQTTPVFHPHFSLSVKGAALIRRFEGSRNHPYNDATSPPVCTVGVGHAFRPFHPCSPAEFRETLTDGQVTALLMHDISWAEACVNDHITRRIEQSQFDALVSFTFNLGCGSPGHGGLWGSSVLVEANAGNPASVASRLLLYDHAGAVELPGLKTRRIAEGRLYVTGDYGVGIGRYLPPKPVKPGPTSKLGVCSGIEWPHRPRLVYRSVTRCERSTR